MSFWKKKKYRFEVRHMHPYEIKMRKGEVSFIPTFVKTLIKIGYGKTVIITIEEKVIEK